MSASKSALTEAIMVFAKIFDLVKKRLEELGIKADAIWRPEN